MAWLRSYILRSTYQWIVDHGMTPYLLVNESEEGVIVPKNYVEEGQIILNLSPYAVREFVMGEKELTFVASFSGEPFSMVVPYTSVLSLYSKESGQGAYADEEQGQWGLYINELDDETSLPEPPNTTPKTVEKSGLTERLAKSRLKVVK